MKKYFPAIFLLLGLSVNVFSFAPWRNPEAAGKNSIFFDVKSPYLSFDSGFELPLPEFSCDYLLPTFLPFSLGIFLKTPDPNLKHFGLRAAYHVDFGDEKTDFYLFYCFDFGWIRNDLLEEYNDPTVPIRFFDFRAGVRRLFGKYFCLSLETDYKLTGLVLGLSIKIL